MHGRRYLRLLPAGLQRIIHRGMDLGFQSLLAIKRAIRVITKAGRWVNRHGGTLASMPVERYLAGMGSNATIAGMIEGGYTITVFCRACDHNAVLDLEALAVRLGPAHGALADTLLPRLRCSACGGKRLGMIVGLKNTPGM